MNHPSDPTDNNDEPKGYVLPRKEGSVTPHKGANEAADVIRDKLNKIYASEPDALQEERQAEVVKPRSVHQEFMHQLNHSGKDLAQVQIEWHNYYLALPDDEKHKVWQEFYASNDIAKQVKPELPPETPTESEKLAVVRTELSAQNQKAKHRAKHKTDTRSAQAVQDDIRNNVGANGKKAKLTAKQHLQSLIFGFGVGTLVLLVVLFSFFNEVIIAPFIQPSRTVSATPLIVDSNTVAPSAEAQVIIPKINVQIPLRYDISSNDEETMQKELESGVAHYPTTSMPGQNGNGAYFGHSSNNIFNKGKYKFAFVLLHQLVPGDTFYITKDSKVYAYKVFSKTIVEPNEVSVLNPVEGHPAVATLITCDPPGTSLRRLVIVGDQISPDVSTNSEAAERADVASATTEQLAGNGQTLWGRFIGSGVGKAILIVTAVGIVLLFFRLTAPKPKY